MQTQGRKRNSLHPHAFTVTGLADVSSHSPTPTMCGTIYSKVSHFTVSIPLSPHDLVLLYQQTSLVCSLLLQLKTLFVGHKDRSRVILALAALALLKREADLRSRAGTFLKTQKSLLCFLLEAIHNLTRSATESSYKGKGPDILLCYIQTLISCQF